MIRDYIANKNYNNELITGNLSEALPVLGAGMKTSVEVFPGHLEVGTDSFQPFFLLKIFSDKILNVFYLVSLCRVLLNL
jgi:hypothetical protein